MQPHVLEFFRTLSIMNKWSAYILSALEEGEASSTDVTRRIGKITNGTVFVNAGSVNVAVKRLSKEGYVTVSRGRRGSIYHITPKGKEMIARLYRLSAEFKKMKSTAELSNVR